MFRAFGFVVVVFGHGCGNFANDGSSGDNNAFNSKACSVEGEGDIEVVEGAGTVSVVYGRQVLDNMVSLCKHLLTSKGEFLAMKGLVPNSEIAVMDSGFEVTSVTPLTVPGCNDQRHLVRVKSKSSE